MVLGCDYPACFLTIAALLKKLEDTTSLCLSPHHSHLRGYLPASDLLNTSNPGNQQLENKHNSGTMGPTPDMLV